jgi:ribonuclease R
MAERRKGRSRPPLPSRQQILEFVRDSPTPVGKREIARAFQIGGADRIALKAMLKDLERDGALDRGRKRRLSRPGALPEVAVLEIAGTDPDGEVIARPVPWAEDAGEPPLIYMAPDRAGPALARGDRVLARLTRTGETTYDGRVIRRLTAYAKRIIGVYRRGPEGGRIEPTSRRVKEEYRVAERDAGGAEPGEIVVGDITGGTRLGLPQARIVERLGRIGEPRSISLIAIHEHDIPTEFSAAALAQAEAARPAPLGSRADLRDVPLVTIDGSDARDFDDAVWAEADPDPANPGGWHLLVAIADVAHYVRTDDALDRAAYRRGNSVYFPDRVVPMLPEALSNGLCSLKPREERPCLAVHLWIDADGHKRRHRFVRGLMRSAARLTYEQVQAARDGFPDDHAGPLLEPVIAPLYGGFAALLRARERRGTLELDLPERRVILGPDGKVAAIEPRQRLDSHRLIEEYMIAANVAAAETLEARRQPAMYRVHDAPDPAKIEALRTFLATLGLRLARGQLIRPATFTRLLGEAASTPFAAMVSELVLRSQSQAVYSPENLGHFGLALTRYAHFTSPIRRYSDLLVHRGLIAGLRLGEDGLTQEQGAEFEAIGAHISSTERRAAAAERDAVDRFTAAFLAERVGELFAGRITGVTRFGLFVALDESGASGLVPVSSLPADFYDHDEAGHALVGRRWGRTWRLGERVMARLVEAQPLTGGLLFHVVEGEESEQSEAEAAAPPRRGGRRAAGPPRPGGPSRPRPSPPRRQRGRRPTAKSRG